MTSLPACELGSTACFMRWDVTQLQYHHNLIMWFTCNSICDCLEEWSLKDPELLGSIWAWYKRLLQTVGADLLVTCCFTLPITAAECSYDQHFVAQSVSVKLCCRVCGVGCSTSQHGEAFAASPGERDPANFTQLGSTCIKQAQSTIDLAQ